MKIHVEPYGNKIDVDGNLSDLIEKKECQILITIKAEDHRNRYQFILNAAEAEKLSSDLTKRLNDPILKANGFKVI